LTPKTGPIRGEQTATDWLDTPGMSVQSAQTVLAVLHIAFKYSKKEFQSFLKQNFGRYFFQTRCFNF